MATQTNVVSPVTNITTGTTTTITLPSLTVGQDVIVHMFVAAAGVTVSGVADDADGGTNTYATVVDNPHAGAAARIFTFHARAARGKATTLTITVTHSSTGARREVHAETWSGLAVSAPDKTAVADGAAGTSHAVGPTATLAQADELVFAFYGGNGNAAAYTETSGWSRHGIVSSPRSFLQHKVVAATTAISATVTSTNSISCAMAIATFKIGAGVSDAISVDSPVAHTAVQAISGTANIPVSGTYTGDDYTPGTLEGSYNGSTYADLSSPQIQNGLWSGILASVPTAAGYTLTIRDKGATSINDTVANVTVANVGIGFGSGSSGPSGILFAGG